MNTYAYTCTYRAVNSEGRTARRCVQRIRRKEKEEEEKKKTTRKNYAFQDVYYTNVERYHDRIIASEQKNQISCVIINFNSLD